MALGNGTRLFEDRFDGVDWNDGIAERVPDTVAVAPHTAWDTGSFTGYADPNLVTNPNNGGGVWDFGSYAVSAIKGDIASGELWIDVNSAFHTALGDGPWYLCARIVGTGGNHIGLRIGGGGSDYSLRLRRRDNQTFTDISSTYNVSASVVSAIGLRFDGNDYGIWYEHTTNGWTLLEEVTDTTHGAQAEPVGFDCYGMAANTGPAQAVYLGDLASPTPDPPSQPTALSASQNAAETFTTGATMANETDVDKYRVRYKAGASQTFTDENDGIAVATDVATTPGAVVSGVVSPSLSPDFGDLDAYTVAWFCGDSFGQWGPAATQNVNVEGAPGPPTALSAVDSGGGIVTTGATMPSPVQTNLHRYRIRYKAGLSQAFTDGDQLDGSEFQGNTNASGGEVVSGQTNAVPLAGGDYTIAWIAREDTYNRWGAYATINVTVVEAQSLDVGAPVAPPAPDGANVVASGSVALSVGGPPAAPAPDGVEINPTVYRMELQSPATAPAPDGVNLIDQPPGPPTAMTLTPFGGELTAKFTMPADTDASGYAIRWLPGTGNTWTGPTDGNQFVPEAVAGPSEVVTRAYSLPFLAGSQYEVAAFARDTRGQWSVATTETITMPLVDQLVLGNITPTVVPGVAVIPPYKTITVGNQSGDQEANTTSFSLVHTPADGADWLHVDLFLSETPASIQIDGTDLDIEVAGELQGHPFRVAIGSRNLPTPGNGIDTVTLMVTNPTPINVGAHIADVMNALNPRAGTAVYASAEDGHTVNYIWDYYQTNAANPPTGEARLNNAGVRLRINYIDATLADRTSDLMALDVGDTITIDGVVYDILGVNPRGNDMEFTVSAQTAPSFGLGVVFTWNVLHEELLQPSVDVDDALPGDAVLDLLFQEDPAGNRTLVSDHTEGFNQLWVGGNAVVAASGVILPSGQSGVTMGWTATGSQPSAYILAAMAWQPEPVPLPNTPLNVGAPAAPPVVEGVELAVSGAAPISVHVGLAPPSPVGVGLVGSGSAAPISVGVPLVPPSPSGVNLVSSSNARIFVGSPAVPAVPGVDLIYYWRVAIQAPAAPPAPEGVELVKVNPRIYLGSPPPPPPPMGVNTTGIGSAVLDVDAPPPPPAPTGIVIFESLGRGTPGTPFPAGDRGVEGSPGSAGERGTEGTPVTVGGVRGIQGTPTKSR